MIDDRADLRHRRPSAPPGTRTCNDSRIGVIRMRDELDAIQRRAPLASWRARRTGRPARRRRGDTTSTATVWRTRSIDARDVASASKRQSPAARAVPAATASASASPGQARRSARSTSMASDTTRERAARERTLRRDRRRRSRRLELHTSLARTSRRGHLGADRRASPACRASRRDRASSRRAAT